MEKKLKKLLDYQKFEQNPRLQKLIGESEARLEAAELSDESLEMVSAAGEASAILKKHGKLGDKSF